MSMSPGITAALDQVHAHSSKTLDQLVDYAREMSADGMDDAQRVALIGLALWDVLGREPANLAGLTAAAIARLADQPAGGGPRA